MRYNQEESKTTRQYKCTYQDMRCVMRKKQIRWVVTLLVLLLATAPVYAALPSDVEGESYQEAVEVLMAEEIITGSTDGLFYPGSTLTRAQACVMTVKATGLTADPGYSGFSDMSGYGWAEPYIKAAVEYGIVTGYGDSTFRPGNPVSMNELVTFVLRASGYGDDALKGTWPSNYVEKGVSEGLYEGLPGELPKEATKWMAAQMIYNGLSAIREAELEKVLVLEESLPDVAEMGSVTVYDMNFVGPKISLSLEDAIERMKTTGPGLEAAVLARDLMAAAAKSSSEGYLNLRELSMEKGPDGKVLQLSRSYYTGQADIRFEIAKNNLETSAVESYFQLLQAEENHRIAQENLGIKEKLLNNVKRKYTLGVAARVDVTTATSSLLSAQVSANEAQTALAKAKMAFNIQMNYPLMQDVVLTDKLIQKPLPDISLEKAIQAALTNRNEIATAEFERQVAQLELDSVFAYPRTSATYLNALATVRGKEMAEENTLLTIEMEIRGKYMDLLNQASAVSSAKSTVDNAREALRISNLSYNAGLNTLTDVMSAETGYYQAQLALSAAITELDLAIYDFEFSMGKGTKE